RMTAPLSGLSLVSRLRYRAEAAIFFAFMGLFRILGVGLASATGGFLGRMLFYRTSLTNRARANLSAAYPEKRNDELNAIIREMWDNLGRTIAEYAHLDRFSCKGPRPRIEIANLDIVDRVLAGGKGVLFVSGHFANWEILPLAASQCGVEG